MTYQDDVREFHLKGQQVVNDTPITASRELLNLRDTLIYEEYKELEEAIEKNDNTQILAEAVDLVYVVIGTCVSLGLPFDEAWKETHKANMNKFKEGYKTREDGKILKPVDWEPANIFKIIKNLSSHV